MAETVSCPGCKVKLKLKPEYAGKKIKCPKCASVIAVPGAAGVVTAPPKVPKAAAAKAAPAAAKAKPPFEDDEAAVIAAPPKKKGGRKSDMSPCPECGEMVDNAATKCPHCKTPLEVDDEAEYEKWKKCPACGQRKAKRVLWTLWGSFYFTALFKHVRCADCGKTYNGKTGKSNAVVAAVCVTVPLLAIAGIGIGIWFYYKSLGY
jgi:uncharacterized protein YbaR (Trm112 family)